MPTLARTVFRIALLSASILAPLPASATTVRPMNLEEMSERAARIFVGRCADVEAGTNPAIGRRVTHLTFDVEQVLKGALAAHASFRSIGGREVHDPPGARDLGVPRIEPGEEVVLFLYGESALGLSSPVGLGQGRFRIFHGKDGRRYVENDFANRFLIRGISPVARERLAGIAEDSLPSPLPLETLLEMVRRLQPGDAGSRGRR